MTNKDSLIEKIVSIEWVMFQNVNNIEGGTASCQKDKKTFEIMRIVQFISWQEDTLESYLNDLEDAQKTERNLLTEKYARMMESNSPSEYAQIKHLLPPLDPEVPPLIEKIIEISRNWEEEVIKEYPFVTRRGRPVDSSDDNELVTSIITYLRGELATYSKKTLSLYYDNLLALKSRNINGAKLILEETVKKYGYETLEKANEVLAKL